MDRGFSLIWGEKTEMDFAELIAALRNPGEDGVPDSIYDDLSASYTDATSTRDAKITTSESRVAELELELLAAKAANWDLFQQIPQGDPDPNSGDNDPDPDSDDTIGDDEDFFEEKED